MELKITEKVKRGSPLAYKENTICVYGPSGSGKTTQIVEYLKLSGKSCIYLDLDGNTAPLLEAGSEVLDKMNYVKLRNSLDSMHVAEFLARAMDTPILNICLRHGFMNCGMCKAAGDDILALNFTEWRKYDLVIVDSVTIMVKAIILFSIKQAEAGGDKSPRDIWQRVSMVAQTMMHFLRECHPNVIVISHPTDVRLPYEQVVQKSNHPTRAGKELVDPYYLPCFGSVPFTKESAKNLSAVIYVGDDGKIITNAKKPFFANARREIKSTTVAGALQEILD